MKIFTKAFLLSTILATILAMSTAFAAEKTVTLSVENLFCASCPYIVKKTLASIPGVKNAEVSYESKTAVVTFDDTVTNVSAMTEATRNAGYPSRLVR